MQHSLSKSSKRLYILSKNQSAVKTAMLVAEITEKEMKLRRRKDKEEKEESND